MKRWGVWALCLALAGALLAGCAQDTSIDAVGGADGPTALLVSRADRP